MPLRHVRTTERQRLDAHEARLAIYARDRGTCRSCGFPVTVDAFEVAHRIADTVANRLRWGDAVIDDPRNVATTHAGRCNSAQNIGFNPVKARALADEIRGVPQ
jgi:5-methylcytosine-specific restriction endonuclease McrA